MSPVAAGRDDGPSPDRALERAVHADLILRAAVAAADPAPPVAAAVAGAHALHAADRVRLLATGKAAAAMARAALAALPRPPVSALLVVPHGTDAGGIPARVLHASHPVPDATSVRAGRAVAVLLGAASAGDIVLALISGGTSSLCTLPRLAITIGQYAALVRALQHAGADIAELNAVRGAMDILKAGGMARLAAPAPVIGLVVSDVVGSPLDVIASGPFSPPAASPRDARRVLEAHGLWASVPGPVRRLLAEPAAAADTYAHVTLTVVIDNRSAVLGAARAAERLGYDVRVNERPVTGMARDAGSDIARHAIGIAAALRRGDRPVCAVSGGETTVVVTGTGTGGRNQELALAAALVLRDVPGITVGSIGTDGADGPTDAAGAVADGRSVARAAHSGSDAALALDHNDSHAFFDSAGGLIRTGPTGTNVIDVQVALIDPP